MTKYLLLLGFVPGFIAVANNWHEKWVRDLVWTLIIWIGVAAGVMGLLAILLN